MARTFHRLAQRAAGYSAGGMNITVAAAQVVNEALDAEEISYADLYDWIQTFGPLYGYSVYLVPWGNTGDGTQHYEELGKVVNQIERGNFIALVVCARLLIRVESIRLRLKGNVSRLESPAVCVSQDLAGHLTLREIALFCARSYSSLREELLRAIERQDTSYQQLYVELRAAVRTMTLNAAVFRPGTDQSEMLVYAVAGCTITNHALILDIADCALRHYYPHAAHRWNDQKDYWPRGMQPPATRVGDRRWRMLEGIRWPWGGGNR